MGAGLAADFDLAGAAAGGGAGAGGSEALSPEALGGELACSAVAAFESASPEGVAGLVDGVAGFGGLAEFADAAGGLLVEDEGEFEPASELAAGGVAAAPP